MRPNSFPVYQVTDLDRRLADLQSQIERLTSALHVWRETQDHLPPIEQRLAQLTERCAAIVDSWAARDERAQHDASARIEDLQRTLEHEWSTFREVHDAPVKQLREQTATLTEVCVATATSALSGFDRAEARLSSLESGLYARLNDLSDQVQAAVNEVRSLGGRPAALPRPATAWPLEGVVRLHNQLRESGGTPEAIRGEPAARTEPPPRPDPPLRPEPARLLLPEGSTELSARVDTLERAVTDGQSEIHETRARASRMGRLWWAAAAVGLIGFVAAGVLIVNLQRQMGAASERVAAAERQAEAATAAASQQVSAVRADAAVQIADARSAALKAQTISDVLAAPDLIRYNLVGGDETTRFTAQLLWSRSRGLVFSASRLPQPPANAAYQIWLLTTGAPVSAGVFVPDAAGRFTLATDTPPRVPRAVAGVSVTIEPAGGGPSPKGVVLLARAAQ